MRFITGVKTVSSHMGALHVYGGDFFATLRNEWDSRTLREQPFDIEHARAVFAEVNKRLAFAGVDLRPS